MGGISIENIKARLKDNYDVIYREINCKDGAIYIIFIDSLCDSTYISEYIISPLIDKMEINHNIDSLKKEVILAASIGDVDTLEDATTHVLSADVVVLFSFMNKAVYCSAKGFEKRSIEAPIAETVIKGPREGFTESINDNISSIRRRVKTPNLKIENIILGEQSKTAVALLYIEGITPVCLIDYIKDKMEKVREKNKKGFVLYSNYIEEELKCKGTAFDTIGYTEKPDIAASKLIEGRVIIIMDGTPFVITAPYFFIENFQTTDDYTTNKFIANQGRVLRWVSFFMSVLVPGLYLALITYHFKLIPSVYIFRMAIFRAGVPVPASVELLIMIFFFQIIREAGVRLPQPIGPTLSIVGALILGEAAVNSGLASQVTIVVVAITSIASYLVPTAHTALFLWNVIIVIFSSLLGLPGYFTGVIVFVAHISGLTSCGYPYIYPVGTLKTFKYKDDLWRGDLSRISDNILDGGDKK